MYSIDTKNVSRTTNYLMQLEPKTNKTLFYMGKIQSEFEKSILNKLVFCCVNENSKECYIYKLFHSLSLTKHCKEQINYIFSSEEIFGKKLKNYFVVGSGEYGHAISTNVSDDLKIILKISKKDSDPGYIHEYIVGNVFLNDVRDYFSVPNFSYVYGIFKCNNTVVENNKLINLCGIPINNTLDNSMIDNFDENVNIIYEYVGNVNYDRYIQNCGLKNIIYSYIQILNALCIAYKDCSFIHYDLHTENVICRTIVKSKYCVKSYRNNEYIVCEDNIIPTIIDYGFCHVRYEEKHLGILNGPIKFGTYQNKTPPLYDSYKLLMFMLNTLKNYGMAEYNELKKLLLFFKPNMQESEVDLIVDEQRKYFYYLPYNKNTAKDDDEYEMFVLEYLEGDDETYSYKLNDHKTNNIETFIDFCEGFCVNCGFSSPFVKDKGNIPVVNCSEGNILFV